MVLYAANQTLMGQHWRYLSNETARAGNDIREYSMILIHDVSNWQSDLSPYWQMFVDKGCKAVIIKMTEGYAYWKIAHEYARQAKEHGLLVGSYHYYRQTITNYLNEIIQCDPKRQAKNYYDWVNACPVKMDLPPALDIENGNNPSLSTKTITTCLYEIERLFGRKPMVYSSPSILNGLGNPAWGEFPLWLAHYTDSAEKVMIPKPWTSWVLWQFSDKITYDRTLSSGLVTRKPIDHNYFNGTEEEFTEFANGAISGGTPTQPTNQVKVICPYLRLRERPALYEGTTLIAEIGQVFDKAGELISADGVVWQPVKLPAGYGEGIGYLSANWKYIAEVR